MTGHQGNLRHEPPFKIKAITNGDNHQIDFHAIISNELIQRVKNRIEQIERMFVQVFLQVLIGCGLLFAADLSVCFRNTGLTRFS